MHLYSQLGSHISKRLNLAVVRFLESTDNTNSDDATLMNAQLTGHDMVTGLPSEMSWSEFRACYEE